MHWCSPRQRRACSVIRSPAGPPSTGRSTRRKTGVVAGARCGLVPRDWDEKHRGEGRGAPARSAARAPGTVAARAAAGVRGRDHEIDRLVPHVGAQGLGQRPVQIRGAWPAPGRRHWSTRARRPDSAGRCARSPRRSPGRTWREPSGRPPASAARGPSRDARSRRRAGRGRTRSAAPPRRKSTHPGEP